MMVREITLVGHVSANKRQHLYNWTEEVSKQNEQKHMCTT